MQLAFSAVAETRSFFTRVLRAAQSLEPLLEISAVRAHELCFTTRFPGALSQPGADIAGLEQEGHALPCPRSHFG